MIYTRILLYVYISNLDILYIESLHIFPDTQLGFRPARSCIDSLVILTSDIHKGFINNSPTIRPFLDIKGAFDNVVPNILIQDLINIGIPARIRMFILNLICEKQLHFVIDGNLVGPAQGNTARIYS